MTCTKPSIMMIISRFRPVASGAELQAERLACKLVELGHPLQVLTERVDSTSLPYEMHCGMELYRCDFPLAYWIHKGAGHTLKYLIRKLRTFDILHNHQMWGHAVVSTLVARWLGKKNIIKLACAGSFGDLAQLSRFPYAEMGLRVLRQADAIVAISKEIEAELLAYGFDPNCIHSIPNGVDLKEFQRTQPIPRRQRRRFILLGRRTPQKGIDTALKALKILADKGLADSFELNLYGWDYPGWDYRQMASELGVKGSVNFLPFEDNILDIYREAYCLILPSVGEGLSNVLLEAMAMEMPVIASRVSGNVEVVEHQQDGLLIPPRSPEALAAAMEVMLTHQEQALKWGRQARLKVQEYYSLDAVAQQYSSLYESLMTKTGLCH